MLSFPSIFGPDKTTLM